MSVLVRALQAANSLATPHGIDRYVELVLPTWSSTDVRAKVVAVRHPTPSSVTLTLRPNLHWKGFSAGQHIALTVEIDGVRNTRAYSLANSPGASAQTGTIELTCKAHPDGYVSRWLVDHAETGLVVGLDQASGDFVLPDTPPPRLLLISGGSGITPVMSMLRTLCETGYDGDVTFAHYALHEGDMIYRDEVAALAAAHPNVRLVRIFTDAPGTGDLDGFVDEAQLDAIDPHWRETATYLCGPPPLMADARTLFEEARATERLHIEAFTIEAFEGAGTPGGALRFARSGITIDNDGRPILAQAEDAGLVPAFGCRMGVCRTCVRRLERGAVQDVKTGVMTDKEGTFVRLCVSTPVGDTEVNL